MKIALVGGAPSSNREAPYGDPNWKIWGLAFHAQFMQRWDLLFEIHEHESWHDGYKAFLKGQRVVMHPNLAKRYDSTPYPYGLAKGIAGGAEMMAGSLDHMMALAISKKPKEIGLWGFDLVGDDEYLVQRETFCFWRGVAIAKGIRVTASEKSPILAPRKRYGDKDYVVTKIADGHDSSFYRLMSGTADMLKNAANTVFASNFEKRAQAQGGAFIAEQLMAQWGPYLRGQDVSNNIQLVASKKTAA